jgi:hypothetical protein
LYKKPGVIPETIYHLKETVERFNTLEQPRIEKLLDDVDLTIQESQKVYPMPINQWKTLKNYWEMFQNIKIP